MKYFRLLIPLLCLCLLCSCTGVDRPSAEIVATTGPVNDFTRILCLGTGLQVTQLITENVSCLHDYTLNVNQVKAVERAEIVITNGAGLEDFMADILTGKPTVVASQGMTLLESCHGHQEEHEGHSHDHDPHIWLSPEYAMGMAKNICAGLKTQYPLYANAFDRNLTSLLSQLQRLLDYGKEALSQLKCRELITFHDGFGYFAHCFDLEILEAVEEESGSEASAKELIHLIELVQEHKLPAIFREANGSVSAAQVISRETGVKLYELSMAMSGGDYFSIMYANINTLRRALG